MSSKEKKASSVITEAVVVELVAKIYEAAVDPARWPDFLQAFGRAVRAPSALIYSHNVETHEAVTEAHSSTPNAAVGFDPSFMKSLGDHYNTVNVWARNESLLKPGQTVTGSMLFPAQHLPDTEWYNDWLRPQGLFHALGGLIVQDGPWAVKFSGLRSRGKGDYQGTELSLYQVLLPHLMRAARVQRRFAFLHGLSTSSLGLLDALPHALFLLDTRGRILHMNSMAEVELRRGDPLRRTPSGELGCARDLRMQSSLRSAIRSSLDPVWATREGVPPIAQLVRRSGQALSVQAVPLPSLGRPAAISPIGSHPAACALIVQPAEVIRIPFGKRYRLTPAETKVATLVGRGKTIRQIARELSVSPNTVKTQLRGVYAKTGTHRQAELIRLVLREESL
jgi:DNA-binding CsgD family transcriptional regulator